MKITKSGLIVATDPRPPVYGCLICGEAFADGQEQQYQRHVTRCADSHEQEIHEASIRQKAPGIFGQEGWDTELEAWLADNRDKILEGRVKP